MNRTTIGDSMSHLAALGLDDPSRYRTVRVPVLDAHEPIRKRIRDPAEVSGANPEGLVDAMLTLDEGDLATIAANTNRRAAHGRPPVLQIGHTPLEDRPEAYHPRPVGLTSNYAVEDRDGKKWLCADLHYRVDQAGESSTYPNISVERVDWRDAASHRIDAVSLLRRRPARDVPLVPYEADPAASLLCCYGREVPARRTAPPVERQVERRKVIDLVARYGVTPAVARAHLLAGTTPPRPEPPYKPKLSFVDWASQHGLTNVKEAKRKDLGKNNLTDFGSCCPLFMAFGKDDPSSYSCPTPKYAEACEQGLA